MICFVGDIGWDHHLEISSLPSPGETVLGRLLHSGPAGASTVSAAESARQGAETVLVAPLGADRTGEELRDVCSSVEGLRLLDGGGGGETQMATVLMTGGERTVVVGRGTARLEWGSEMRDALEAADIAHVNVEDAELRAQCRAAIVGRACLPLAHLSEEAEAGHEWEVIVGSAEDHPRPPRSELAAVSAGLAVLTRAARGGEFAVGGEWGRYAPVPAARSVDTTGAGDAFLGGLLSALDSGASYEQALASAARSGADAVGRVGAWPPA